MKTVAAFIVSLLIGTVMWVFGILWKFALGWAIGWVISQLFGSYIVAGLASLEITLSIGVIPLLFGLVGAVGGLLADIFGSR